ncbi:MAG: OmpA family protein [Kangiellaceae bacterium]|nr:OmpA family protein [Kangiellaceae bacterium]
MKKFSYFILSLAVFMGLPTLASYKVYEADLSESEWQFSGNPLGCQLTHNVPHYGDAIFNERAGKNKVLQFGLNYKRQPITATNTASVHSLSPSWQPTQRPRNLGEIAISSGAQIFKAKDTTSWKLLNELEVGRFPTFRYQEFESIEDQVAVSLSAVGFKNSYDQFLTCLTTLVDHSLDELMKMTLRFDFDQHTVRDTYKKRLRSLAAYIKHDQRIDVVFVNGHTDNKGSKGYNRVLAQKRIDSVKKILMAHGADEECFRTLAYGESSPVATNRRADGRAKNRRVFIKVAQK